MSSEKIEVEAALDGLMTAARYSEQEGHDDLCYLISHLYQLLGERELGEGEWCDIEEMFPAVSGEAAVRLGESSYQGGVEMETWHFVEPAIDLPSEDADVLVEFSDTDDAEFSGEFYFSASETQSLILELLKSLNQEIGFDEDEHTDS